MQPNLPISGLYQIPPPNDVAIQFAPYNAVMLIHRKAEFNKTRCGLALPEQWGEWAAMGSFAAHLAAAPDRVCEECAK